MNKHSTKTTKTTTTTTTTTTTNKTRPETIPKYSLVHKNKYNLLLPCYFISFLFIYLISKILQGWQMNLPFNNDLELVILASPYLENDS